MSEDIWPYKAGEFAAQPPPEFAAATRYRIKNARKIAGIDQIKSALTNNGPIVAGITVYQSMMQPDVMKTGMIPLPKPNDSVIGGHAVCIVGYDDQRGV